MIWLWKRLRRPQLIPCGQPSGTGAAIKAVLTVVLVINLTPRSAGSLPLYARQTGEPCATCHTAFLELTPCGRRFKLGACTQGGGDWKGPPFAVFLQPGFTHLQESQPGG